jgi:hypothetical protein
LSEFPQLAQNFTPSDRAFPQFVQCILVAPLIDDYVAEGAGPYVPNKLVCA